MTDSKDQDRNYTIKRSLRHDVLYAAIGFFSVAMFFFLVSVIDL